MQKLYGGIEAGGTKIVCLIGSGPGDIRAEIRYPTTDPEETIGRAIAFFQERASELNISAVGIASFGPLDPDPGSPTYGQITSTPKPGWAGTDIVTQIKNALALPVGFDTDVNGAALAEWIWGAGREVGDMIYLTIGTGIGGGGIVNRNLIHGLVHPEMGHILIPHDLERDPYEGGCPFHGDCLEGLASGPAIESRWGMDPATIPPDHEAWKLEAHYLALGLANIILTLSPKRIILGGGVMQQRHLFPKVRLEVIRLLSGYVNSPGITLQIDEYIVPPALGTHAGPLGAIALARRTSEAVDAHRLT